MNNIKLKYQVFNLTPDKFMQLCYDLLQAEFNYDKLSIIFGPNDSGVDISGTKGVEKTAVHIKHKYRIDKGSLEKEIQKYSYLLEFNHKFIYLTSSLIDKDLMGKYETDKISIISQTELFNLLDKHSDIAQRYFTALEQKTKSSKYLLTTASTGVIISVIIYLFTFMLDKNGNDKPLTNRIENVEVALKGIKGLEEDLKTIKDDMIQTELENKRILEEYEKVQGVEELINEKKEFLNIVLNYQPWYKKFLSYFLGLITGVFTSIIGSILFEKWKLKRALEK